MTNVEKPAAPDAERAVVASLLAKPGAAAEVIASGLTPRHFAELAPRAIYAAIVEGFYADEPLDPLSIAARSPQLGAAFGVTGPEVARRLQELADDRSYSGTTLAHARLIREAADGRRLLKVAEAIERAVGEGRKPDEIAGNVAHEAHVVAMSGLDVDLDTHLSASAERFLAQAAQEAAAKKAGVELGAYFGIPAIDGHTRGLRPTELLIAAGEPGVGKSIVWWRAGLNFAARQAKRPEGQRVGTLILSLEMGEFPSQTRIAHMLAGVDGGKWRDGTVTREEYERTRQRYAEAAALPLWIDHSPTMRASQIRAMVAEYVRKHNVGLVIVDHFRMWDLDERMQNKVDEDEEKARFLKEQLAGALNVAVVCLAHTRKKSGVSSADARPTLSDLRGSGQIAAHSDFVCFIHRPWLYASEREKEDSDLSATDAEMVWGKNRHGQTEPSTFYFDPEKMLVL